MIIQSTSISHAKGQYFNRAPLIWFCAPRLCTIQNTPNSQAKTHPRTPFLQNGSRWLLSNVSYFFGKAKKELVFHNSSVLDTIKIKLLFTHNSEKSYFNLSLNCLIWNTKNHFKLAFYFMLTVSLKFSQTSLIIKEFIKYENKFNRKVFRNFFLKINFKNFHFMKGSKKGYHEHFSVVYTMKLLWNTNFMKWSERNISQCILALKLEESNATNFFIHSLSRSFFKKKMLTRCWFPSIECPNCK